MIRHSQTHTPKNIQNICWDDVNQDIPDMSLILIFGGWIQDTQYPQKYKTVLLLKIRN